MEEIKASSSWISSPGSKRLKVIEEEDEQLGRYWPECVIAEILARLPIKSILRLKSTCKSWYSLIRSRCLIDLHRQVHLDDSHHKDELFYCRDHSMISCLSSSLVEHGSDFGNPQKALAGHEVCDPLVKTRKHNEPGIHVLMDPSNNGICCVIAEEIVQNTITKEAYGVCKIAFCNLATREFSLVEDPFPFVKRWDNLRGFHRVKHWYGFGSIHNHHHHSNLIVDYKIVVMEHNQNKPNQRFRVSMYSQRRGSWALIYDSDEIYDTDDPHTRTTALSGLANGQGTIHLPLITHDSHWLPVQAYLNGCCHWIAKLTKYKHCIMQFDMDSEVFGLISGPPDNEYLHVPYDTDYEVIKGGVFVLNHHLAVIITVNECVPGRLNTEHIDVWMMMEYGVEKSWAKIFSCDFPLKGYVSRVLGMSFSSDTRHIIDRIFFEHNYVRLMSLDRYGFQEHSTFKDHWACWKPRGLSPYADTLEPVTIQRDPVKP